jgi:hypothetical protein
MPLFSRKSAEEPRSSDNEGLSDGDLKKRDELRDRGLLSAWFMRYRLEQEVERALRYGRPLAIMMAQPELLVGERLARAAHAAAAEAALAVARSTDLVGWADDGISIMIVMPETDPDRARIGTGRVRDEIWMRGRAVNGPKWNFVLLHDPDEFKSRELIDELIRAGLRDEKLNGSNPATTSEEAA